MMAKDRGPDRGATKVKGIRVADELWSAAQVKAAERGETLTDAIRRFLVEYAGQPKGTTGTAGSPMDRRSSHARARAETHDD